MAFAVGSQVPRHAQEVGGPMRFIIMAKAPIPGKTKTRLAATIGAVRAAQVAEKMLDDTIEQVCAVGRGDADKQPHIPPHRVELHCVPAIQEVCWQPYVDSPGIHMHTQVDGDLGERMWHALCTAHEIPSQAGTKTLPGPATLLGTDCPGLTSQLLEEHALLLDDFDAVITPANDGGYVAFSMRQFHPSLFQEIDWSSERVLEQTVSKLRTLDMSIALRNSQIDVDTEADLTAYPHLFPHLKLRLDT